jgi:cell division protein FtsA
MKSSAVVAGIDIGSTKVAFAVGQINEGLIEILSLVSNPSMGLRRGIVVDIEDCISSVSSALELAERQAGTSIDKAIIGIGGSHIVTTSSKGIIAVSRPNGQINQEDVERVIDAARAVALPPNQEILHIIPSQFIVDGQEGVKDPLGMTGIRLEAEVLIIGGASNALENLEKSITPTGLKVDTMIFNGLASSRVLLNKKQKEAGVMLLDIGGGTTTLAVWEEGDLIYADILAIGSNHVTNDIAIGLKTTLEVAEKVKIKHARCLTERKIAGKIDLKRIDPQENQKVEKALIAEIARARMKEIFEKVKGKLRAIEKDGMLPAGAILTGGGSQIKDCLELAKQELHLPAQLGLPILEVTGMTDNLRDPRYSTAVGLMLEGLEESPQKRGLLPLDMPGLNRLGISRDLKRIGKKVGEFLKQLLP